MPTDPCEQFNLEYEVALAADMAALTADLTPAHYEPTEADYAEMADAFGWDDGPSDEDLEAMAALHEEMEWGQAEMESAALYKMTGGQWS